jgi:hypothetical protein
LTDKIAMISATNMTSLLKPCQSTNKIQHITLLVLLHES